MAPQPGHFSAIDAQQRRLFVLAQRLVPDTGETPENFARRRGREAGSLCTQYGRWSVRAARRCLTWQEHIIRNHAGAWLGHLLGWSDAFFLRSRRQLMNSLSVFAGTLGLRTWVGHPRTRWEEGLKNARNFLQQAELKSAKAVSAEIMPRDFERLEESEFKQRSWLWQNGFMGS